MKKVSAIMLICLAVLGVVYAGTRTEDVTTEQKNNLIVAAAHGAMSDGD